MTNLPTEAELKRAKENAEAFAAISRNLIRCTAVFFDVAEMSQAGSGTFVTIAGRLFFLTAAHTLPANPDGRLSFVTDTLKNVEESKFPILGFATSGDWPDVGYLELPPDVASKIGKTPITLDRISPRPYGSTDAFVYLAGYPGALMGRQTSLIGDDVEQIDCDFNMVFYPGRAMLPAAWPQSVDPPTSEATDLFLPFDLETELYKPPVGFPNSLARPEGTSGGGWWQRGSHSSTVWNPEGVQLIGIQSRWHERRKYIRGCQIHHLLRLMHEHEPSLRNALQAAFPELFG